MAVPDISPSVSWLTTAVPELLRPCQEKPKLTRAQLIPQKTENPPEHKQSHTGDEQDEGHQSSEKVTLSSEKITLELNVHANPFKPEDKVDETAISPEIRQLILKLTKATKGCNLSSATRDQGLLKLTRRCC